MFDLLIGVILIKDLTIQFLTVSTIYLVQIFGVRNCPWSQQTVKTTDSCPKDKSEMEERSKGKNCEALAQIQNCTEPQKFKYHCVINELGNAIVEVCAEAYYIHGEIV